MLRKDRPLGFHLHRREVRGRGALATRGEFRSEGRQNGDGREVGWIWMDHNRFWNEDFQFSPQIWYYTIFNG